MRNSPSGLQPTSIRVSGHSQLLVPGLNARPLSQGMPVAVTREQAAEGMGGDGESPFTSYRNVGLSADLFFGDALRAMLCVCLALTISQHVPLTDVTLSAGVV